VTLKPAPTCSARQTEKHKAPRHHG
jgi:hypothetical protein